MSANLQTNAGVVLQSGPTSGLAGGDHKDKPELSEGEPILDVSEAWHNEWKSVIPRTEKEKKDKSRNFSFERQRAEKSEWVVV